MHGFAWAWLACWLWGWLIVAVALAPLVGGILRARRYEMEEAQHVAGPGQPAEPAPEYGSMILAEEQHHEDWLPAPPVDAEPWDMSRWVHPDADVLGWREQTMAELAPETLANDLGGWPIVSGTEGAEGVNAPPVQHDPGPGDDLSSLASPGPDQPSTWLAEQLDVLRAWSDWQQQKVRILA